MAATVLDANFKSAGIALSGGNLTATITSGTSNVGADHKVSGLTYFEFTLGASITGSVCVGLVNNAFNTGSGSLLGVDANSVGYKNDGTVRINNSLLATVATYAAGNVVGVAANPQAGLIWFRVGAGNWNNDVIANQNPVGNVGGIALATLASAGLRPAFGGTTVTPNQSATATFTSGFANTPPTGYITIDTLAAATVQSNVGQPANTSALPSPAIIDSATFKAACTVSNASPVPTAQNLAGGTVGTTYTETISAQGGSGGYSFALQSGSLPTGTSLNSSTGIISGTPTVAGSYTFTVRVTDSSGAHGDQAFTIGIAASGGGGGASNYGWVM